MTLHLRIDRPFSLDVWTPCQTVPPDTFFPEKGGSAREAKVVCRGCESRDPCLQFALDRDERWGIYGGLTERERRRLHRRAS